MNEGDYKTAIVLTLLPGVYALGGFILIRIYAPLMKLLRRQIPRTEAQKKNDPLFDRVCAYFSMLSGRLSVLFIGFGLFFMAAESIHNWIHADDQDPRVNATLCLRDGTCEVS